MLLLDVTKAGVEKEWLQLDQEQPASPGSAANPKWGRTATKEKIEKLA
jgi:hypothetical protein